MDSALVPSVSWVSSTTPSTTILSKSGPQDELAGGSHTHDTFSSSGTNATNLPPYRQLKVIEFNSPGEPATLPAGIIGIFDSAVPEGWTRYSDQDNQFIRGSGTANTTGGSSTHSHSTSFTTEGPTLPNESRSTDDAPATATDTHTHTGSGTSNSTTNLPPYIDVILGKLDTSSAAPSGLIMMWTGNVPADEKLEYYRC